MTLIDQPSTSVSAGNSRDRGQLPEQAQQQSEPEADGEQLPVNVSESERMVSLAAGAILGFAGLGRGGLTGLVTLAVGGGLIYRGYTGHCHAYRALGLDTANAGSEADGGGGRSQADYETKGVRVEQAFMINKSPEELYRYWRDFNNLPRIMTHLEEVRVIDDRRSHWVVKATGLPRKVEWDAEITADEPNTRIAWRSTGNADVDNAGEVRFTPGPADRGTEVHVTMHYVPPAGAVGRWAGKLYSAALERQVREDLRNFKRVMEIGEVLTTVGQPRGTCTGQGKREA